MKLAIMQPYFFPYVGYFQLIAAVDKFVIYDDVQFIKGGWINRNRILLGGEPKFLTVPLAGASPNRKINELQLVGGSDWRRKMLKTLTQAYGSSCYFAEVSPLVENVVTFPENHLATFIRNSLVRLVEFLQIETELVPSSSVYANANLRGAERVLDICRQENASVYVNAPGGREIYDEKMFRRCGIDLRFLESERTEYDQGVGKFQPNLSLIDVLMFNGREKTQAMLQQYQLVA